MLNNINYKQKLGFLIGIGLILLITILHNPFGLYEKYEVLYTKEEFIKLFRESTRAYDDVTDDQLYYALLRRSPELRSWIIGESQGEEVATIVYEGTSINLGIKPPPAYYGEKPRIYSRNALFHWINQPSEYLGFIIPILIFIIIWIYIFRDTN